MGGQERGSQRTVHSVPLAALDRGESGADCRVYAGCTERSCVWGPPSLGASHSGTQSSASQGQLSGLIIT